MYMLSKDYIIAIKNNNKLPFGTWAKERNYDGKQK